MDFKFDYPEIFQKRNYTVFLYSDCVFDESGNIELSDVNELSDLRLANANIVLNQLTDKVVLTLYATEKVLDTIRKFNSLTKLYIKIVIYNNSRSKKYELYNAPVYVKDIIYSLNADCHDSATVDLILQYVPKSIVAS